MDFGFFSSINNTSPNFNITLGNRLINITIIVDITIVVNNRRICIVITIENIVFVLIINAKITYLDYRSLITISQRTIIAVLIKVFTSEYREKRYSLLVFFCLSIPKEILICLCIPILKYATTLLYFNMWLQCCQILIINI